MRVTLLLGLALLGLIGCGPPSADSTPKRIKTTGRLIVGNKSAVGAVLLFHPVGDLTNQIPFRALVEADGQFNVKSADGSEGLPEGKYVVTVVWSSGSGENGDDGRSLVPDKYRHPTTSPLQASVHAGPNGDCTLPTYSLTK